MGASEHACPHRRLGYAACQQMEVVPGDAESSQSPRRQCLPKGMLSEHPQLHKDRSLRVRQSAPMSIPDSNSRAHLHCAFHQLQLGRGVEHALAQCPPWLPSGLAAAGTPFQAAC